MSQAARRRPGRPRHDDPSARDAIAEAAGRLFAAQGYDATSVRAIAGAAGVDPSLVAHHFGDKQQLFLSVVALPIDGAAVVRTLLEGPEEAVGQRLAELALGLMSDPGPRGRIIALVRAAATNDAAAALLRERLTEGVLEPLASSLGRDRPRLRASLLMSQTVGLMMARHVVGLEPLSSAGAEELAAALAPVLQHYLTGDLGSA